MLSRVAREVFGGGIFHYAVQATTAMILLLAANTAYADFPRLSSFPARDRFIAPADETRDAFVHRNDLVNATSLQRGDRVEFGVGRDERGRTRTVRVRVVELDPAGAVA